MSEWINVKDKLPPFNTDVLTIDFNSKWPDICVAVRNDQSMIEEPDYWSCYYGQRENVTHWMPLPEPPEKE